MEQISYKCRFCSGTEYNFIFHGKDRLHSFPGDFKIEECKTCGLIAIHPMLSLEEVEQYYPQNYISYPSAIESEHFWFKRLDRKFGVEKRCMAVIKRSKNKNGRILDIGCATGVFLNGMRQYGWECYGIEPSDFASTYAIEHFALNVVHGYLEEDLFDTDYFDVITLWDVMEHLPEPVETLRIIYHILKPGGLLVVTTPNARSWERKIFGQYWAGWDVPRHYHIFTPKTFQSLVNFVGLTMTEIHSFTGMHGSLVISIEFMLKEKNWPNWCKKIVIGLSKSIFCRVMLYPYFFISNKFNRSTSVTYFVKKVNNNSFEI